LELNVTMRMRQRPLRRLGHVYIADVAMLPLGGKNFGPAQWQWELLPEDVEHIENDPTVSANGIVGFQVGVNGLAKVTDAASGAFLGDICRLSGSAPQVTLEISEWERLIGSIGYRLPSSQGSFASGVSRENPAWGATISRLSKARQHHRRGEDDDALRDCLNAFEALTAKPYSSDQWKQRFNSMPEQKARGLAELFSGLASFCNTVGHHRSDAGRDAEGNYPSVPLDHWEADLILGASQFLLTYALRLKAADLLS